MSILQQIHTNRLTPSTSRSNSTAFKLDHNHTSSRYRRRLHQNVYAVSGVSIDMEVGPSNSRFIFAGVDIQAPPESVWQALTSYENLQTFIPGLSVNKCLARRPNGARLLQIGQQDVGLGFKFSARCVLDCNEHPNGLEQDYCVSSWKDNGGVWETSCDLYPIPRSPDLPCRDITFQLVEGDFLVFRGLWRVCEDSSESTHLSYSLFVRPHVFLPVSLIESRIKREVIANLKAVGNYVEKRNKQLQERAGGDVSSSSFSE